MAHHSERSGENVHDSHRVADLFAPLETLFFLLLEKELTDIKFWDDCRFFRVLPGFVVQFGINGNPETQKKWRGANLPDDPVKVSNDRGTVVFATAGPNSRTTQLFINTRNGGNGFLDKQVLYAEIRKTKGGAREFPKLTYIDILININRGLHRSAESLKGWM